jgi:hypothetical protein
MMPSVWVSKMPSRLYGRSHPREGRGDVAIGVGRFSRSVGMAPMEYLLHWRMVLANRSLEKDKLAVAEIAGQVAIALPAPSAWLSHDISGLYREFTCVKSKGDVGSNSTLLI